MSAFYRALVLKAFFHCLLLLSGFQLHAQAWLPGYNYRKKITISKAMVVGNVDLQNFQLLIALEHADLRYVAGACTGNKISGTKGRDFAFTTVAAPQTPLNFQLEEYVPASGRLTSWVRLNTLAAAGSTTPATQVYLYYGSNNIHFPAAAAAQQTWNNDEDRVWHMNPEVQGAAMVNAASSLLEERLQPGVNMNASNVVPGKIGSALHLNGSNQHLSSGKTSSNNFLISCWLKFAATDRDQVILSTDSAAFGGYVLKLEAGGRLVQETRNLSVLTTRRASLVMVPDKWYHVVSLSYQGRRDLLIDGVSYNVGLGNVALRSGGTLIVGASKQHDRHFGGLIDELRIQAINPGTEWLHTSYINQRDPASFYVVAAEERIAELISTGMVFNNVLNQSWSEPGNWNSKEVPGSFEQVVLAAGARARLSGQDASTLHKLSLEADAQLELHADMEVLCDTEIALGGKVSIGDGFRLQLDAKLLNDGLVASNADAESGGLVFSGASAFQQLAGSGRVVVQRLLLDKPTPSGVLQLGQAVDVLGHVRTNMGRLQANGYLTLKHSGPLKQAFLWPLTNVADAGIEGEVVVEQYVAGGFPAPATARGWRLQSAPVYHGSGPAPYHHLYDWKAAVFVTGPGGSRGGFDDSPQNGHTIYTHNQSIAGSLSQKYTGISVMNSTVDVGRGIYVFSRGDRSVPEAFVKQIQTAPFENPAAYTIHHKGLLFQGDLQVELQNRNMGESGDGFNLLGNPYASAIGWGALQKENVSPYVWKFNPLNNAYDVSNNPNTQLLAGEGFFVKVLGGFTRGSVGFSESAKLTAPSGAKPLNPNETASRLGILQDPVQSPEARQVPGATSTTSGNSLAEIQTDASLGQSSIHLTLGKDVFEQQFTLLLTPDGHNEVNDLDATALGTGYVSISSIAAGSTKLSVDARRQPGRRAMEVPLYVKGYSNGKYELRISGTQSLEPGTEMILSDKYLKTEKVLQQDQVYSFDINTGVPESFGEHRFALLLKAKVNVNSPGAIATGDESNVLAYPNPFVSSFKLKLPARAPVRMEVRLRDLMGKVMLSRNLGLQDGSGTVEVDTTGLAAGTYLVELINLDISQSIKTLKLIKR